MPRNYRSEAEDYVRRVFLREKFTTRFSRERMRLSPGGIFDFDAVSEDENIICCISTSAGMTSGGNKAISKLSKMKADVLNLLLVDGDKKRIMVFTDRGMAQLLEDEQEAGRIPKNIEIFTADLPSDIHEGLYKQVKNEPI